MPGVGCITTLTSQMFTYLHWSHAVQLLSIRHCNAQLQESKACVSEAKHFIQLEATIHPIWHHDYSEGQCFGPWPRIRSWTPQICQPTVFFWGQLRTVAWSQHIHEQVHARIHASPCGLLQIPFSLRSMSLCQQWHAHVLCKRVRPYRKLTREPYSEEQCSQDWTFVLNYGAFMGFLSLSSWNIWTEWNNQPLLTTSWL